ncbi:MAG: polyribonucleotide nucleotidyltransferase [Oscillospiraceae bacterium]|nr:polyribonucleotide nucleotidyltransferase [Oscillospiraceae bacterium]
MFKDFRIFETQIAGRKFVVEVGKMAKFANGSCLVRYGETVVLVTATASILPREGIDFFPLSVDFEEKLYSVGKIPGSFLKREGKPSEKAILSSRAIDRSLRPLFSNFIRRDVSIVCTVVSVDEDCSAEVTALIGASIALSISDIPWNGPTAGVCVGLIGENIIINPTALQFKTSRLDLKVASTAEKVLMLEAGADCVPEDVVFKAIVKGHEANQKIVDFIQKIQNEVGKSKKNFGILESGDLKIVEEIKKISFSELEAALKTSDKNVRDENLFRVYQKVASEFLEKFPESDIKLEDVLYKFQKDIVRSWLIDKHQRVDGRSLDEIRDLSAEVGFLPRAHGSSLFTRGETQVITAATLGPMSDNQKIDDLSDEETKRYMHHYNFPSFSVGETRPSRGPGRREIGHGALAERALEPVLPSVEKFPYSIRLVSEVLSSCGSTSQGAVCASTLALMDAGVPIKEPVAGISCGLVTVGNRWVTFVDIQGIEDFFGDMDFKVAGTRNGITAIQMDLKIDGLTHEIIEDALSKTRLARVKILEDVIDKTLSEPRKELSKYAPKVLSISVPVEKIREVIGAGGRVVQAISTEKNVKIDIQDDGRIFVMSSDIKNCQDAVEVIRMIIKNLVPGDVLTGKVTKIMDFGVFVEFAPGREGMCHISKLSNTHISQISDFLRVGDVISVIVMEVDSKGRINLRCITPLSKRY